MTNEDTPVGVAGVEVCPSGSSEGSAIRRRRVVILILFRDFGMLFGDGACPMQPTGTFWSKTAGGAFWGDTSRHNGHKCLLKHWAWGLVPWDSPRKHSTTPNNALQRYGVGGNRGSWRGYWRSMVSLSNSSACNRFHRARRTLAAGPSGHGHS